MGSIYSAYFMEDWFCFGDSCPRREGRRAGNRRDKPFPSTVVACDYMAEIPIAYGVDFLNVVITGAIAFWEATRCARVEPRDCLSAIQILIGVWEPSI